MCLIKKNLSFDLIIFHLCISNFIFNFKVKFAFVSIWLFTIKKFLSPIAAWLYLSMIDSVLGLSITFVSFTPVICSQWRKKRRTNQETRDNTRIACLLLHEYLHRSACSRQHRLEMINYYKPYKIPITLSIVNRFDLKLRFIFTGFIAKNTQILWCFWLQHLCDTAKDCNSAIACIFISIILISWIVSLELQCLFNFKCLSMQFELDKFFREQSELPYSATVYR